MFLASINLAFSHDTKFIGLDRNQTQKLSKLVYAYLCIGNFYLSIVTLNDHIL